MNDVIIHDVVDMHGWIVSITSKPSKKERRKRYNAKYKRINHHTRTKQQLIARDGMLCCYCKIVMVETPNQDDSCTIEHIIPRYLGGDNNMKNLLLACHKCNNVKSKEISKLANIDSFMPII